MSKAPNYLQYYRNRHSDKAPAVSDQSFLSCKLQLLRCRDLGLGPMTLKLNSDSDILNIYHYTKNEVAR